MTKKTGMQAIEQRLFRVETLVWILAGKAGLEIGTGAFQLVSAMLSGGGA